MSPSAGYGLSPWGTGYWGEGILSSLEEGGIAYAVGDRVVRIELVTEPLHTNTTALGSALNPRTWTITDPASSKSWTVMAVKQIQPNVYDILTLEPLPKHFTNLKLSTSTLKSITGISFATLDFDFNGAYLDINNSNEARSASRGYLLQDLANQPTPPLQDISGVYNDLVGGTLEINSSGDYVSQYGAALIKKLVIRRLLSKPGDFFHLPTYGVGLRVKEPIPTSNLRKLAVFIEQQVQLEPEVQAARANLSYSAAANALEVRVRVRLAPSGQETDVMMTVPTGLVQL